MISWTTNNNKNIIISILIILILLGGYILKSNYKSINNENEDANSKDIKNELKLKYLLESFEKSIMKSTDSLIKFNQKAIKSGNYTNLRNELFTKDVIKQKIITDSSHKINGNNADYKIDLSSTSNTYKNVIGFRLIESVIPLPAHNINSSNNKIIVEHYDDNNNGHEILVHINEGFYTFNEIADRVTTDIIAAVNNLYPPINGVVYFTRDKFNILPEPNNDDIGNKYRYKIVRQTNDSNNNLVPVQLIFKFKKTGNNFYKLLGFDNIDEDIDEVRNEYGTNFHLLAPLVPIQHIQYLDIVIPEIPTSSTKLTTYGKNIIDRIFINAEPSESVVYRVPESEVHTTNYFYPIKLNSLSIKILMDGTFPIDPLVQTNYFEFEITMLKNTKLMN